MAVYLYSRVSTSQQDNLNQIEHLKELYPNGIIVEEIGSGNKRRPELERLVQELTEGDELIVYALDRLGRRASEVLLLVEELDRKKVNLKSIRESLDFGTVTGRFTFQILAALSEMERSIIAERTKAALAAKKKQGVQLGRPSKYDTQIKTRVRELRQQGKTLKQVSAELKIPIPSLQYLLKD